MQTDGKNRARLLPAHSCHPGFFEPAHAHWRGLRRIFGRMTTTTRTTAAVLNSLIETCRDGQEGFHLAADEVKSSALQTAFLDLSLQRAKFAAELQEIARGLGAEPEKECSVAAALHHGWTNIKSVLSNGDEHAVLAECERGEDTAIAEYRDALEHELPTRVLSVVRKQYAAVQAAHDRVRDLRDASAG